MMNNLCAHLSVVLVFISLDAAQFATGVHSLFYTNAGLILGSRPANERRRYKVTASRIGWAQTNNQPWN